MVQDSMIVVDERSLEQYQGTITGVLYWRSGTGSFPDPAWSDFPVIVLRWWVEATVRLIGGVSVTENYDFMDGPFRVTCRVSGDSVSCKFLDRRTCKEIQGEFISTIQNLGESIGNAAELTLSACKAMNVSNRDTASLNSSVQQLKTMIQS